MLPAQAPAGEAGFFAGMVGRSPRMREIFGLLKRVAPMDVSVVVTGETGTGKELVARALHDESPRRKGPFVVLDCGSIPENLIESELFGHEKGAFTGATSSREGAFERADGGTIFLDEIGELRIDMQPRLLRVLENHEVRRVGGSHVVGVNVRVVAATNRDLAKEVEDGAFREDLYFRLGIIHVQLPPLRARPDDVPWLIEHALSRQDVVSRHGQKRVTPAAMALLQSYGWPGNVRELVNVVSHLLTFSDGAEVDVQNLPPRVVKEGEKHRAQPAYPGFRTAKERVLSKFEREYLATLLERCEGNLSRAARESGLHRKSIERLARKYRLDARTLRARRGAAKR
jgi:DNA-binding NtrC family response regulator